MFGFDKRKFDTTLFRPTGGVISGIWFSNPHVGIDTGLFFSIEISLAPFRYDGQQHETSVALDWIRLPVTDYRQLANRSFTFPINPSEGYVDGSVYISHMHNPFDVTQMHFGSVANNALEVRLAAQLSFEDHSIEPSDVSLSTKLTFGDVAIHCDTLLAMSPEQLQVFTKDKLDPAAFTYDHKDHLFRHIR